jgi:hypothetical protein
MHYNRASDLPAPSGPAETRSGRSLFTKFGSYAAPLAAVAALAAPVPRGRFQQIYSVGAGSSSGPVELRPWFSDDVWLMTSAEATQREIDELNRLFRLSVEGGTSLDLID